MKKLTKDQKSDKKFFSKYYKTMKDHDDEIFLYCTYPRVKRNLYVISSYGKVINFKTNKVLKTYEDKDGYKRIGIQMCKSDIGSKSIHVGIHRLVAWEFCEKKEDCNIVNHLDTNNQNNYCENLEWTTVQGNTLHAIEHGLTIRSGFGSNGSRYEEELILDVCHMLEDGLTPFEVFKVYYPSKPVSAKKYRNFYQEIYRLKYDENFMRPVRSQFNISTEKAYTVLRPWTEEETNELKNLILSGKSNKEILHHYGFKSSRVEGVSRIVDKTSEIRKDLGIPNPNVARLEKLKEEIYEMVKSGKTNKEILKYYGSLKYNSILGARIAAAIYRAKNKLQMENPVQTRGVH